MAACLVFFIADTLHWPLVGDAVSVHYLILLMQHGMAPYRQIVDAQMPGTYLIDWAVMHTFGGGALGLRLFDFTLLAGAMVAMIAIAWPNQHSSIKSVLRDDRWAAFLAGGLFALVHGRDGIPQAGQRDLIMAVLLLAAYACTFHAVRREKPWLMLTAGFCASTAVTIKPTVLPAAFAVFLIALLHLRGRQQSLRPQVYAMFAGISLPLLAVTAFLLHVHAVAAFLQAVRGMWPYYATLQRRPVAYLLTHSLSPLLPLVGVWLLVLFLSAIYKRKAVDGQSWERSALYTGLLLSLASFVLQGKGFPYHRYPFLAFLTLVIALDCSHALRNVSATMLRYLGALGLIVAALFIAPLSAYKISRFAWRNDDYYTQLSADLDRLGGHALSGHVQCMDAFSGCISTLYRMDLVQSTGFLVDFYFFAPQPNAVVDDMRQHFWQDLQQNPPRVFVVSKQVFPVIFSKDGEPFDTYGKLQRWPAFNDYLNKHYALVEEHEWSRPVLWASHADHPAGYRIYVRRP